MMKLEVNGPNSWWMETHSSPRQSRWLQDCQTDVEETVKIMLKLIEGSADSFAQRAEDYYQKRPQLVKQVENLYRAYRSLADHHDQLVGTVRQNLPKALQTQYGLTCDSPRSSPLLKQLPLMRRSTGMVSLPRDFDSPHSGDNVASNGAFNLDDQASGQQSCNMKSKLWVCENELSSHGNWHQGNVEDKGSAEECKRIVKDCQDEKGVLLPQQNSSLHEDSNSLGVEMTDCSNVCQNLEDKFASSENEQKDLERDIAVEVEKVRKLDRQVGYLQEDNLKKENEIRNGSEEWHILQERIDQLEAEKRELEDEIDILAQQEKSAMTCVRFLKAEVSSFVQRNKELQKESTNSINQKKFADISLKEKDMEISSLNHQIELLMGKVAVSKEKLSYLQESNYKQKTLLEELSEEKREAIRQLCFTIDVMKDRHMKLEEVVGLFKKKAQISVSKPTGPGWKSMLARRWMRISLQPCALAL